MMFCNLIGLQKSCSRLQVATKLDANPLALVGVATPTTTRGTTCYLSGVGTSMAYISTWYISTWYADIISLYVYVIRFSWLLPTSLKYIQYAVLRRSNIIL